MKKIITATIAAASLGGCVSTNNEFASNVEIKQEDFVESNNIYRKLNFEGYTNNSLIIKAKCGGLSNMQFAIYQNENDNVVFSLGQSEAESDNASILLPLYALNNKYTAQSYRDFINPYMPSYGLNDKELNYISLEKLNALPDLLLERHQYVSRKKEISTIGLIKSFDLNLDELASKCLSSQEKDRERIKKERLEREKAKKEQEEKLRKHIAFASKNYNAEPMFIGNNIGTFMDVNLEVLKNGESHIKDRFLWVQNDNYTVKKVIEIENENFNLIVLSSDDIYSRGSYLPVALFTSKKAVIGQRWEFISNRPLVFKGVISKEKMNRIKSFTFFDEQYLLFQNFPN